MSRNSELKRSMLDEILGPNKCQRSTPSFAKAAREGQRALSEKRDSDAVSHLTQAISSAPKDKGDLLSVYERRAKAYIRLQRYEPALKDAKQILRLDASDARGYILCAHIEMQQSRWPTALQICKSGLVRINQRKTSCLAKVEAFHAKAEQSMERQKILAKATDPLQVLPLELLGMLFDYFDYRESVAIMRVSKSWRDHIRSSDLLRRTVDTRTTKGAITYMQVKAMFARLSREPQSLALARLRDKASQFVSKELSHWVRWEGLTTLVIADQTIELKQMKWAKFKQLRNLTIGNGVVMSCGISDILAAVPTLTAMTVDKAVVLDRENVNLNLLDPLPQLKRLSLCFDPNTDIRVSMTFPSLGDADVNDQVSLCSLPLLEYLDMSGVMLYGGLQLLESTKLKCLRLASATVDFAYPDWEDFVIRIPPCVETLTLDSMLRNISDHEAAVGSSTNDGPRPVPDIPLDNVTTLEMVGPTSCDSLVRLLKEQIQQHRLQVVILRNFLVATWEIAPEITRLKKLLAKDALRGVKTLVLDDCNLDETALMILGTFFPDITDLIIQDAHALIPVARLSNFIREHDHHLRFISIKRQSHWYVNDPNFIPWARQRNVEVKILDGDFLVESGRRVRYE